MRIHTKAQAGLRLALIAGFAGIGTPAIAQTTITVAGFGGSTVGATRERSRANQPFFSGSVSLTASPQESRERSSSPR